MDCDLAWPGDGKAAVTKGKKQAEFEYSEKGLALLVDLVNSLSIPATFFFEARTALELDRKMPLKELMEGHEVACHGFEHEDFTKLSFHDKKDRLARSKWLLEKIFGRKIRGFRAPFLKADAELMHALKEENYSWDSSCTVENSVLPQITAPKELYFWPLIEGTINEEEFWNRINAAKNPVLSTHSWHSVVDLNGKERKPEIERRLLNRMAQEKYEFATIATVG